jgi:hypothetical protein
VPAPFNADATQAVAVDRSGRRGALLLTTQGPGERLLLVPLDLGVSPPRVLAQFPLSWAVDPAGEVALAVSADGSAILAVGAKAGSVALLATGGTAVVEDSLPAGQSTPVAVAATPWGQFHVANRGSRNVSVVRIEAGKPVFDPPLDPALPAESGAPVATVASGSDEVALLFERDLVLVSAGGKKVGVLRFPLLFADKATASPGVGVAIQP